MNVCFITYGATVQIHDTLTTHNIKESVDNGISNNNGNKGDESNKDDGEAGNDSRTHKISSICPRALVFRGTHEVSLKKM